MLHSRIVRFWTALAASLGLSLGLAACADQAPLQPNMSARDLTPRFDLSASATGTQLASASGAGCLTVTGGALNSGAPVTVQGCVAGTATQTWTLATSGTSGLATVGGTGSTLCLDAWGASGAVGAPARHLGLRGRGADHQWTLTSDGLLKGQNGLCATTSGPGGAVTLAVLHGRRHAAVDHGRGQHADGAHGAHGPHGADDRHAADDALRDSTRGRGLGALPEHGGQRGHHGHTRGAGELRRAHGADVERGGAGERGRGLGLRGHAVPRCVGRERHGRHTGGHVGLRGHGAESPVDADECGRAAWAERALPGRRRRRDGRRQPGRAPAACSGVSSQKWTAASSTTTPVTTTLTNGAASALASASGAGCLTVSGGSVVGGAMVTLQGCMAGTATQTWTLAAVGTSGVASVGGAPSALMRGGASGAVGTQLGTWALCCVGPEPSVDAERGRGAARAERALRDDERRRRRR